VGIDASAQQSAALKVSGMAWRKQRDGMHR
jgi:hypothetical protein